MKLYRYFQNDHVTLGVLKINNTHAPIFTLELPWRENKTNISCIPIGKYKLEPFDSPTYGKVWRIIVPGREAILFHIGNYIHNTKGCILVGLGVMPEQPMVNNSAGAMALMRDIIKKKQEIEIINI